MNAPVKPKELAFPERKLEESPSSALWNLVWTPKADTGGDGSLCVVSQDVDMD